MERSILHKTKQQGKINDVWNKQTCKHILQNIAHQSDIIEYDQKSDSVEFLNSPGGITIIFVVVVVIYQA